MRAVPHRPRCTLICVRRLKKFAPAAVILVALMLAGSGSAWTLNEVQLDTNYCRENLQIGSDKTASHTATPSFLLSGDGGLSSYTIFIDGASIGTWRSDGYGNVCIYDTLPLAEGAHVLTGNELSPHSTYTTIPLNFSVDTVLPPAPTTPALS